MIRSMTAYAGAENAAGAVSASIEIRGYNSRYLDTAMKIPPTYQFLEERIKPLIAERISRGRVEVKISVQAEQNTSEIFEINKTLAEGYYRALRSLKENFGITGQVPLELLAAKSGVIEPAKTSIDEASVWEAVSGALYRALDDFLAMKAAEGNNISADIEKRLFKIGGYIEYIENKAHDLPGMYQKRLKERVRELTGGEAETDEARIAQETAFLADKSDISEEIVRAESHLDQFRNLMSSPEPAGRPLNFLLQEFNREFNTMGSKAGSADISHTIVNAKTELEKIREQVQNIE